MEEGNNCDGGTQKRGSGMLLRLLIAALLGLAMGVERELKRKSL